MLIHQTTVEVVPGRTRIIALTRIFLVIGNLQWTALEENQIVAFLQTLTAGYTIPYPDFNGIPAAFGLPQLRKILLPELDASRFSVARLLDSAVRQFDAADLARYRLRQPSVRRSSAPVHHTCGGRVTRSDLMEGLSVIDVLSELTEAMRESRQASMREAMKSANLEQHCVAMKDCLEAWNRKRAAWLAMATPLPTSDE